MTIDKTIVTVMLVFFVVIAIPVALFFRKLPDVGMSVLEKELTNFSNTSVTISPSPQAPAVFSGLESPVKAVRKPVSVKIEAVRPAAKTDPLPKSLEGNPAAAASKKLQSGSLSSLPAVSMIYFEGDSKMAVIGGQMLREGASFGSYQVLKIEKTRVQVRSAGKNIWLNMD